MQQFDLFTDVPVEIDTPFTGRVVCSLGNFRMSAKLIQQRLRDMGAEYKPSTKVSRNVHYVLMGENAPADQLEYLDQLAFHGYCPRVLSERDLDDILKGHYAEYRVPQQIQKDLHLTYAHYQQFHVEYAGQLNPLYTSELFIAPDVCTSPLQLYQQLGDRGIYANPYIDDTTDVFVISDASLANLQHGASDSSLRLIEEAYNRSRAQSYRYLLTTEKELLEFLS